MINALKLSRIATLVSYFGLLITITLWNAWLYDPVLPRSLILLVMLVPLLFPLRGLLHGKVYTHAWTTFIALYYFTLGIWLATDSAQFHYGLLVTLLSVALFLGCLFYPKLMAKQPPTEK